MKTFKIQQKQIDRLLGLTIAFPLGLIIVFLGSGKAPLGGVVFIVIIASIIIGYMLFTVRTSITVDGNKFTIHYMLGEQTIIAQKVTLGISNYKDNFVKIGGDAEVVIPINDLEDLPHFKQTVSQLKQYVGEKDVIAIQPQWGDQYAVRKVQGWKEKNETKYAGIGKYQGYFLMAVCIILSIIVVFWIISTYLTKPFSLSYFITQVLILSGLIIAFIFITKHVLENYK